MGQLEPPTVEWAQSGSTWVGWAVLGEIAFWRSASKQTKGSGGFPYGHRGDGEMGNPEGVLQAVVCKSTAATRA